MKELIAELERAEGGNRRLDIEIFCTVVRPNFTLTEFLMDDNSVDEYRCGLAGILRFSTSIDAALTLVKKGWYWSMDSRGVSIICAEAPPECEDRFFDCLNVADPIISLCIASLRAMEGQTDDG